MPMGRPPKLTQVIGKRPVRDPDTKEIVGHEDITVLEQIVTDIRSGIRPERAALRAGIHRDSFHEYEKVAGRTRARLAQGQVTKSKLTKHEKDCLDFSDRIAVAEVEHQLYLDSLHEQIARGGLDHGHTIIEYEPDATAPGGRREVKRTERRALTLPDARALEWRLKHRHAAEYPDTITVTGEGEGGAIPVEVRAAGLAAAMAAFAGRPVDVDEPGDDERSDAP